MEKKDMPAIENDVVDQIESKIKLTEAFADVLIKKFGLFVKTRTLDEIAMMCSKKTDEVIMMHLKKGLKFIAGELKFSLFSDKMFSISMELYIKNDCEEWVKVSTDNMLRDIRFLKPESLKELKVNPYISFEVKAPEL